MALTRTLIRHAPTDYNSLFLRGLPASLDAEDARRYFCDRGYKCTVSFNKINNEYFKLYVALQFDSEKTARDVFNKYDNEQVLGYNVGLSYYKDKARLYNHRDSYNDHRSSRARVGQPVDRRRFNRTPSPSRRRRSRSRRSRSGSRHSDSDRSHRSRSHSGSSSPKRRNRSKSSDKRRSRTHSSSSSPSSPRTSRKRSKSPKESSRKSASPYNGTRKNRRSASPYDGTRKRRHSRQSLSPSLDATVRSVITKRTSPSPERNVKSLVNYSHSPPPRSRRRTFSGNSTSSSSASEHGSTSPKSLKKKLSPSPSRRSQSPSRSDSAPSPGPSNDSEGDDSTPGKKERHSSGEIHSSPERKVPEEEQPALDQTPKETHKRHSRHSSSRKKSHRKRSDTTERRDLSSERERKSKVPPKASTLSSSIYGKVASFTDMNIQQANQTSHKNGKKTNGSKREDPEDVEADLRAEFLNNNDALYDSHERMQAAGFPLVTKKKAEEAEMILDDLPGDLPPIDPLRDGHQYVRNSVEEGFALTNGGSDELQSKDDVWTPEMLTKLKVKKEEIIQAYKQDCDTFTTVVKMLIGKEADLEMRLQHALKENLKDIGQRCVQELNQLADKLKAEAK